MNGENAEKEGMSRVVLCDLSVPLCASAVNPFR